MMGKIRLPESLQQFLARQTTRPVTDLCKSDPKEQRSPYGSYWCRAVACILLSGRVQAKNDGAPNMTDANRIGKEANFNPYLIERVGTFLVATGAIQFERAGPYRAGPNFDAFWSHDIDRLRVGTRGAILRLVQDQTGYLPWRPTMVHHSRLIEFLTLFFACFRGLALVESRVGQVMSEFGQLPSGDLIQFADGLGIEVNAGDTYGWKYWLDAKGQKAMVAALYTSAWAYSAEHEKTSWFFASPIGLGMLGLEPPPPAPELATVFRALPDLSVFAGSGLAREKLVPLFRYGMIQRIDQVYEFRLDRKRVAGSSSTRNPSAELREVLRDLEPLPATVSDLLTTKSRMSGKISIRWCSALVRPESAEVLAAIREHPQLKGYLEPGAPPGYLLLKSRSNPENFVRRCQELGFDVDTL